jgi:hypothetical protein
MFVGATSSALAILPLRRPPTTTFLDTNMAAPHLLTIPHELRDQIYSYLTYDEPGWRVTRLFSPEPVQFRFHNAPHLNVLHTHPRLRTEFFETEWTQQISVTFRKGVSSGPFTDMITTNKMYKSPTLPVDILFTHWIRHVTILVDCGHRGRGDNTPGKSWWKKIQQLVDALSETAVFLSTVKVAVQQHSYTKFHNHDYTYPWFRKHSFLTPPPFFVHRFWLVQRCEGYRLDFHRVRHVGPRPGLFRPARLISELSMVL